MFGASSELASVMEFGFYHRDNGVRRINEITIRRIRLVLGWMTVFIRARCNHYALRTDYWVECDRFT